MGRGEFLGREVIVGFFEYSKEKKLIVFIRYMTSKTSFDKFSDLV